MIKQAQVEKLLVTAREAAQMLSISERSLWTLTDTGEIPRVQLGRSVRYDVEDLKAFIAKRKSTAKKNELPDKEDADVMTN